MLLGNRSGLKTECRCNMFYLAVASAMSSCRYKRRAAEHVEMVQFTETGKKRKRLKVHPHAFDLIYITGLSLMYLHTQVRCCGATSALTRRACLSFSFPFCSTYIFIYLLSVCACCACPRACVPTWASAAASIRALTCIICIHQLR